MAAPSTSTAAGMQDQVPAMQKQGRQYLPRHKNRKEVGPLLGTDSTAHRRPVPIDVDLEEIPEPVRQVRPPIDEGEAGLVVREPCNHLAGRFDRQIACRGPIQLDRYAAVIRGRARTTERPGRTDVESVDTAYASVSAGSCRSSGFGTRRPVRSVTSQMTRGQLATTGKASLLTFGWFASSLIGTSPPLVRSWRVPTTSTVGAS